MPRLRWSPSGAPTTPCTGAARAGSEAISNPAAPPNSARRPMPSAADIESAAVEGVDVGLTKAARVARQRMFEGGERQPGLCQRAHVAARSEEHTSELQSLMRISSAVFGLKHKKK